MNIEAFTKLEMFTHLTFEWCAGCDQPTMAQSVIVCLSPNGVDQIAERTFCSMKQCS